MFLDELAIRVRSGAGGPGAVSFRREKFVPRGGPDGGDGGRGGDVVLVGTGGLNSLSHLRGRRLLSAPRGGRGGRSLRHGPSAEPVRILVPLGTSVKAAEGGEVIGEISGEGDELLLARGGAGGRGNAHFADSRNRAPKYAELGGPGNEREVILELRLIADVGLVGAPNAGKSTLLGALTAATPRVASYPFTTLEPNLGVVEFEDGDRLVLADVPGLIEGASKGAGLGTEFLKHLSRTSVLVHVVDASLPRAEARAVHEQVVAELRAYDPALPERIRIVALTKLDLPKAAASASRLAAEFAGAQVSCHLVSALEGRGLATLLDAIREAAASSRQPVRPALHVYRPDPVVEKVSVTIRDGVYRVRGKAVEAIVARTDLANPDALARMRRQLDAAGLREALQGAGAGLGDTVMIGIAEFLFDPDL